MADVQSLGKVWERGGGAGRRRAILLVATVLVLGGETIARGEDPIEWVAPPMLEDVPVRSADVSSDPVVPQSIVVPLPPGLASGAIGLAAMGVAQWWSGRRRR